MYQNKYKSLFFMWEIYNTTPAQNPMVKNANIS